jgi:phosphoribosyl 1,2-cyclic phosphate phosphodiesterase
MLKITFLGTGTSQGIPIIGSDHPVCLSNDPRDKRLRVSVMLEWDQQYFVIDCGPDFRQQLLANPIPRLDGLLFTHEHADHTAGLDDIRPFFFRQGALDLYADIQVQKALRQRFAYIFETENKYPGAPTVNLNTLHKDQPFDLGGKKVIPVEVLHNQWPVMGFRIDDFAYLTDVKTIAKKEREKLQGLDILVISALRVAPHPMHLNLEEALQIVEELEPKRTYFTHISHLLGFHKEVSEQLPETVFLAYDNLQIEAS